MKLYIFSLYVFLLEELCHHIFLCIQISKPDEFDVMVPMLVDRASVEPFGKDGAFYSVGLKRGNNPLKKFQEEDTLSASDMLKEFREEVKKSVKGFTGERLTKHTLYNSEDMEESVKCTVGTSKGDWLRAWKHW